MKASSIISYFGHLFNQLESISTFRLVGIIYSRPHGHEICVMQLTDKKIFPKYTTEELLSDHHSISKLSSQDMIAITCLDYLIKERKKNYQVLEIDRNGTILLKDLSGKKQRYSEKYISSSRKILKDMNSEDTHDLGYRVGFKEGFSMKKLFPSVRKSSLGS